MERAQDIQAELASLRARIAHTSRAVVVALQSLPEPGARRLVVDAVLEQAEAVMAMASELNRLTRELHELNADAGLGVDMVAVIRANDVCGASIQELFSVLPSDDNDYGGVEATASDGSDGKALLRAAPGPRFCPSEGAPRVCFCPSEGGPGAPFLPI